MMRILNSLILGSLLCGLSIIASSASAAANIDHPDPKDYGGRVSEILTAVQEAFFAKQAEQELSGGDYGQLALVYQANKIFLPATQALETAIELSPYDSRWPYYLGLIKLDQSEVSAAAELFRKASELNDAYIPAKIRLSQALAASGDNQAAVEVLAPLATQVPEIAVVRSEYGKALLGLGKYAEAETQLRAALELQPQADKLKHSLGIALRAQGESDAGRSMMAAAGQQDVRFDDPLYERLRQFSGSSSMFLSMALQALSLDQMDAGRQLLDRAVQNDPDNVFPVVTYAMLLTDAGEFDKARTMLNDYLANNPSEALAHYAKGIVDSTQGADEQSLQHYQKALELRPEMTEAVVAWGDAATRLKDWSQATRAYSRLRELQPDVIEFAFKLAGATFEAGDCRGALNVMRDTVALAPENLDVLSIYSRIASTCAEASEIERENALNAARNIYQLAPSLPVIETLVIAEAAAGNRQAAEELLAQAAFQALRDGAEDATARIKNLGEQLNSQAKITQPWASDHPIVNPALPDLSRFFGAN